LTYCQCVAENLHMLMLNLYILVNDRNTFGRAIINNSENNDEFTLVKLSELHSDVRTTRKYLGLRDEELMEAYDLLKF